MAAPRLGQGAAGFHNFLPEQVHQGLMPSVSPPTLWADHYCTMWDRSSGAWRADNADNGSASQDSAPDCDYRCHERCKTDPRTKMMEATTIRHDMISTRASKGSVADCRKRRGAVMRCWTTAGTGGRRHFERKCWLLGARSRSRLRFGRKPSWHTRCDWWWGGWGSCDLHGRRAQHFRAP